LGEVKRSAPSLLRTARPDIENHATLLEWLTGAHRRDGAQFFGEFHGVLRSTDDVTNGIMVLLYSADAGKLATFTADQMKQVVRMLHCRRNSLDPTQLATLETMLEASAQTMQAFAHFQQTSAPGQGNSPQRNRP
jgi:hypothetical protein